MIKDCGEFMEMYSNYSKYLVYGGYCYIIKY